jgi:hypothetical protein
MPAAADIGYLPGFLAHLGDLGMAVDRLEEAIDVDTAEPPGKSDVPLGGQVLITEEDHGEFDKGPLDFSEYSLGERPRKIDTVDFGTKIRADRIDADMLIAGGGGGFDLRKIDCGGVGHDKPLMALDGGSVTLKQGLRNSPGVAVKGRNLRWAILQDLR